jgi:DNA polymerase-3 subunit delta'
MTIPAQSGVVDQGLSLKACLPQGLRQLRTVRVLDASIMRERMPHAIILLGDSLKRLQLVAKGVSETLLQSTEIETHPDFFWIRPAKKMRQIGVDAMRELIRGLQHSSRMGGCKVAIIHEADRMNTAAANAFLKTLEEPPPQTHLILITERPYALMETIRSRCFQFRIPGMDDSERDAEWTAWLAAYQDWLKSCMQQTVSGNRPPVAHQMLAAYGLIHQFIALQKLLVERQWDAQKASIPSHWNEDVVNALEVGHERSLRNYLFADIERAGRDVCLSVLHRDPAWVTLNMALMTQTLESVTGLLEVNLKDEVALESFFLKTMRFWFRR